MRLGWALAVTPGTAISQAPHVPGPNLLRWIDRRRLSVASGGSDSLSEEIAKQGDLVRAMKVAIRADGGAYTKGELKAEVDKLIALKAQAAPPDDARPRDGGEEDDAAASVEEISGPDDVSYR